MNTLGSFQCLCSAGYLLEPEIQTCVGKEPFCRFAMRATNIDVDDVICTCDPLRGNIFRGKHN